MSSFDFNISFLIVDNGFEHLDFIFGVFARFDRIINDDDIIEVISIEEFGESSYFEVVSESQCFSDKLCGCVAD